MTEVSRLINIINERFYLMQYNLWQSLSVLNAKLLLSQKKTLDTNLKFSLLQTLGSFRGITFLTHQTSFGVVWDI